MPDNVTARRVPFLTAEWRWLAMLNYSIDPAILAPLVPRGTSLDSWNGETLVSVVGFRFLRTRLLGVPLPLHRDFDEVNLRFYVRAGSGENSRRGVVFIREIVPRRAIALVARLAYNEPYLALPMRSVTPSAYSLASRTGEPGRIEYAWKDARAWNTLTLSAKGDPSIPERGSEEDFITEHYWGYTRQRDGGSVEYEVAHPRWRVWQGEDARLECDVSAFYGEQFVSALSGRPRSAFLAEGSPITVYGPKRIRVSA
ncbi:MAG: DUF2071 domain-containing protein [Anaerolineae bacterium]|nr:DUF2071 domain-containing protein [Gemmatimonadaceae bacterium]